MLNSHRVIESYVHDHRIGVLIEFGMCSEYTARVSEVKSFMRDIALHIAACSPKDINSLLSQNFVKDADRQVHSVLNELSEYVSEEITILRFTRWDVGEGPGSDGESPDPPKSPADVIRMAAVK